MAAEALVPTVPAGKQPSAGQGRRAVAGWRARAYWLGPPVLVTVGLGLYHITQPVLWRDELSGWSLASRSLTQMLATARRADGAELPYYLILHYWMAAFGSSPLALRLPSVLAMAGAAAFVTLAARELAGPRAALASGLIFALVPSVSRFAQEARFYALTLLFAALATWLLARALNRPSWRLWTGYAVSMAAAGYLDIVVLVLLSGHAAWAVLDWWPRRDRRLAWFAVAAAASVAVCIPVMLLGMRQVGSQVSWVPQPNLTPAGLGRFGSNLFYSGPVAVTVLVLAALAWALRPRLARCLTAAALVPLAAVCAVSYGSVSYFFPRYELYTLIALTICAGAAAGALGRKSAVVAVVGLALLGYHDQRMIRQPDSHEWVAYPSNVMWNSLPYQQVARLVGFNARPGDAIVFPEQQPARQVQANLGVAYYIGSYLRPGVPAPRQVLISRTALQANTLFPVPCPHPSRCVGGEPRIWVVGTAEPYPLGTFTPAQVATLRHGYRTSRVWHIGDLPVGLLTRR